MSAGFYKRRRGILEHLEAGTIGLLDLAIHDYLCLKINGVRGSECSIPAGVCFTSAAAIYAVCPKEVAERTIRRSLEHLEAIGWIKRWTVPGKHGNYPVLVARASVHDVSGNEYRVNAEATTDWRFPVYVSGEEAARSARGDGRGSSAYREERVENGEGRKKQSAATAKAAPPVAFQSLLLIVNETQDTKLADTYPWVNRQQEYRKMDLWLTANRPDRKVRNPLAFCQNWFNKIPCPTTRRNESAKLTGKELLQHNLAAAGYKN